MNSTALATHTNVIFMCFLISHGVAYTKKRRLFASLRLTPTVFRNTGRFLGLFVSLFYFLLSYLLIVSLVIDLYISSYFQL